MPALLFPGQGAQFSGMGLDLFQTSDAANAIAKAADKLLGFGLSELMFRGSDDELRQTRVTQPAIFTHSVMTLVARDLTPTAVAGHSLGEFSALVANGVLTFDDALRLVSARAEAMQRACEARPGTMAAILGLADVRIEEVCAEVAARTGEVVVAANYHCPGQPVISGTVEGTNAAGEALKAAGAKRALVLQVGGAFHSPLMQPAEDELAAALARTTFHEATCPVYQNVDAAPHSAPEEIRQNLRRQLTAPVRWTQSVQRLLAEGHPNFLEVGPGKVLQGLVKKIAPEAVAVSA
ncbi:MAG: ACP S-malonyltransferase [Hymenobacteraceae bacterium]|nr:ACP S-malonyltransferase [Hymenobacteraceae bacterium]